MPHTLKRTTARQFETGRRLNLERSLRWGGRVSGHFVAGHVDCPLRVSAVVSKGRARELTFLIPERYRRFVVARGSVALSGVSLTVAKVHGKQATIALIPHTLARTNLSRLSAGDTVNMECDVLARYRRAARVKPHAKR